MMFEFIYLDKKQTKRENFLQEYLYLEDTSLYENSYIENESISTIEIDLNESAIKII